MTALLLTLAALLALGDALLLWRAAELRALRREAEAAHYDRLRALLGDWL